MHALNSRRVFVFGANQKQKFQSFHVWKVKFHADVRTTGISLKKIAICIGLENPSPRGSLISKICCLVKSQAMDPSSNMGIIIHHALLNEAGSILPLGESLYR